MKNYTNKDLRDKNACYDPVRHFEEDKRHTLLDYLENKTCPSKDKIWCVTRFLDDKSNRLFAVWGAKEALKRVKDPDPRSLKAVEVSERFANGEASGEELREAYYAARAVYYAAYDAADAAYYAAYRATFAAYDAAAAYYAHDAADAAYYAAYRAAAVAYHYAAYRAERLKQIEKLKREIKAGNWREK